MSEFPELVLQATNETRSEGGSVGGEGTVHDDWKGVGLGSHEHEPYCVEINIGKNATKNGGRTHGTVEGWIPFEEGSGLFYRKFETVERPARIFPSDDDPLASFDEALLRLFGSRNTSQVSAKAHEPILPD